MSPPQLVCWNTTNTALCKFARILYIALTAAVACALHILLLAIPVHKHLPVGIRVAAFYLLRDFPRGMACGFLIAGAFLRAIAVTVKLGRPE